MGGWNFTPTGFYSPDSTDRCEFSRSVISGPRTFLTVSLLNAGWIEACDERDFAQIR